MATYPRLVAVAYDLNFRHAAEIFSGVADQVRESGLDWQLLPLNFGFEAKLMELAASKRLAGAIGTFVSNQWIEGLLHHEVAAVNLFNFSDITCVPSITLNDSAIAQCAATHLIEQGAKSLTFISQDGAYFNRIRRKSFKISCPPNSYREVEPMEPRRLQVKMLTTMQGPIGILCSNDRVAREICIEARLVGLEAGKDLLIMGIGNDPAESTFAGVAMSSFEIPAREIGKRAAKTLEKQLAESCGVSALGTDMVEARLISRESTLSSTQARLAERVFAAIDESLGLAEFDIAALARRLGLSRRSLEIVTRQHFKNSPYQILSEKRLKRAEELLRHTRLSISKVGEECGYPELHHFSTWFKNKRGVSPKAFRLGESSSNFVTPPV